MCPWPNEDDDLATMNALVVDLSCVVFTFQVRNENGSRAVVIGMHAAMPVKGARSRISRRQVLRV